MIAYSTQAEIWHVLPCPLPCNEKCGAAFLSRISPQNMSLSPVHRCELAGDYCNQYRMPLTSKHVMLSGALLLASQRGWHNDLHLQAPQRQDARVASPARRLRTARRTAPASYGPSAPPGSSRHALPSGQLQEAHGHAAALATNLSWG